MASENVVYLKDVLEFNMLMNHLAQNGYTWGSTRKSLVGEYSSGLFSSRENFCVRIDHDHKILFYENIRHYQQMGNKIQTFNEYFGKPDDTDDLNRKVIAAINEVLNVSG